MSSFPNDTLNKQLASLKLSESKPRHAAEVSSATIVDTPSEIASMLSILESLECSSRPIYVDLEGVNLSRHGTISLVQVYVPSCKQTFLIDVHTLGEQAFDIANPRNLTFRSVLESSCIKKYFFDVRNDADALFSLFGIQLTCVVDVQLLELASRRGPKHVLCGLAACVEQEQISTGLPTDKWQQNKREGIRMFDPKLGGSYDVLNLRPLLHALIEYCVGDVQCLPELSAIYQGRLSKEWSRKVLIESEVRLTESRSTSYQPKNKKRIFGPERWRYSNE